MKINYYTVTFNFDESTTGLRLEGSGISIEFKTNEEERDGILEFLGIIKRTEDDILGPPFDVTKRLLQAGLIGSNRKEDIEDFWERVNEIYLGPYRILLNHAGETEKQRKALRDFFKPIRFRLRSSQTVMEGENNIKIETELQKII